MANKETKFDSVDIAHDNKMTITELRDIDEHTIYVKMEENDS